MEELKKEWVESVIQYERIRKAINKMSDEQEKEALTRYYILREKWKEIKNKMGVSAVSYTHLDVYKRQVPGIIQAVQL